MECFRKYDNEGIEFQKIKIWILLQEIQIVMT